MASRGSKVAIQHRGDSEFSIKVRDHELVVDQPYDAGGRNAGPAPTELFVASIASCAAFFARGYLHRHGLPDAVDVDTRWWLELSPTRVTKMSLRIDAPGLPVDQREAFRRVVESCTVHNTLRIGVDVSFELSVDEPDRVPVPSR